ncbi:MAG: leucine-rich repeat domain-containing protein, partial [Oscillospiraceae bacterium]|nr:leucine-rich repeat domain-containing protein [Oscillospiraceae bacterium]
MKRFRNKKTSILAVLLVVVLIANLLPLMALADDDPSAADADIVMDEGAETRPEGIIIDEIDEIDEIDGEEDLIPPLEPFSDGDLILMEADFIIEDGVLVSYLGAGGTVTIPDGVVEIATGVFRGNTTITRVICNEDLRKIGNSAFQNCTNLLRLTLNEGLQTIGELAFDGDNKIEGSLAIPQTVSSIGQYAFRNCAALTGALVLPVNLDAIAPHTFYGCSSFTGNLVIPGSVATIGQYAFYGCNGLNGTLTLSSGIVTIGPYAFQNCNRLTGNIIIPDSVTSLGAGAFSGCSGFDGRLQLSANMTVINGDTFSGCSSVTGEVVIPDKVTTIYGNNTFYNMPKITSVVFGTGLTAYGAYLFNGDSGIVELTFKGQTVPSLNDANMFRSMSNLQQVYVPREKFDAYMAAYAPYMPSRARILIEDGGDFFIEDGVLKSYMGVGGEVEIPGIVTAIGTGAFQNNKEITKVTFGEKVAT